MRTPKTERNAEIVRRYLARESVAALGREYGVSRIRIHQIVTKAEAHRERLRPWEAPSNPETLARFAILETRRARVPALRIAGWTWREIGELYGVTHVAVLNDFRRWQRRAELERDGVDSASSL